MRSELAAVQRTFESRAGPRRQRISTKYERALIWCLPAVAPTTGAAASVSIAVASAEARLARLGLVHLDVPALELGIVKLTNRVGGLFRCRHLDKAEAFRLSGELVRDDRGALHLASL